jgi:hypothetical protein
LGGLPQLAQAQSFKGNDPTQSRAWAAGAIGHAQKMRKYKDPDVSSQTAPPIIPRFDEQSDPSGKIATFQPGGPTTTARNAFFQNLGTNGRTCFTCHRPETGWSVSAASVQARFKASGDTDPILRLVDGATCPSDDVSTPAAKSKAYSLLTSKGLIRIAPRSADAAPCADRWLRSLWSVEENRLMERTQIFELMSELRLSGMKAAYDEIMATAIAPDEPPRIVGDLLQAEVSEKQARLNDFEFDI